MKADERDVSCGITRFFCSSVGTAIVTAKQSEHVVNSWLAPVATQRTKQSLFELVLSCSREELMKFKMLSYAAIFLLMVGSSSGNSSRSSLDKQRHL